MGIVSSASYCQENGELRVSVLSMTLCAVIISGMVVWWSMLTLLYVHDITIYYSSWSTCTSNARFRSLFVFHTGFCRLDFLYLLQTPHIVPWCPSFPSLYLTSRTLPVASFVTCLGLLLESKILWEPDLR
jgi:hypothetical protein